MTFNEREIATYKLLHFESWVASQENNTELPHMKWDPHSRSKTADGIVTPDGDNLSNRDLLSLSISDGLRDSFLWGVFR